MGEHRGESGVKSARPDNSQKRRKSIIDTPLFSSLSHACLTKVAIGKILFPLIHDPRNEKLKRRETMANSYFNGGENKPLLIVIKKLEN